MLRRISASVPKRPTSRLSTTTRAPACLGSLRSLSSTAPSMSSLPAVSPPVTSSLPSDSFHVLPEQEKAGSPEDALYEQQIRDVEEWWSTSRYAGIKRPYTAADVVSKRGSLQQSYPSSLMARKLWNLIQEKLSAGEPIHTSERPTPWRVLFPPHPAYADIHCVSW